MIAEPNRCPECGNATAQGALDGLCPACIARFSFGLSPLATSVLDEDVRAADAFLEDSVSVAYTRCFGDYELLDEIGRGGMGIVYRARQKRLNRIVAVKMIPFGALAAEDSVRRFRAEAEAVAQLRHPGIIGIHEIGEHSGQQYFSMDYVAGGTLADQWTTGPWPARRAAACLQSVAEAIHYAHQAGIVHRDLKPSNILIDAEGKPHVTDFGLARRLTGDSSLTVTGQVLGSPHYMPPEQASPVPNQAPVPAGDVYSLGAVLYHSVTGRPPFQAESLEAVLARVAVEEPVSPRLLNPGVPRDLETICLKCLQKEPGRRYQTAAELAEELGRFLRDEPIFAKPAGALEKAGRWCRRRPALAATLALLLLVGWVGASGVFWQWRRAESAAIETRRNLYSADMALAYRAFAAGDRGGALRLLEAYLPGASSDPADAGLRGWEWWHLWDQCRGEERVTLGRHSSAVVALEYAPDGKTLVSADVRGGLKVWDVDRTSLLLSTNLAEGRINALAFSPDGKLLAHPTARRNVWLWDTRTWQRIGVLPQADVSHLAFSSDGKTLATANGLQVVLWNVATRVPGKVLARSERRPHPRQLAYAPDGNTLAIADENGVVVYWDVSANTERAGWRAHRPPAESGGTIEDMTFSLHNLLATAGDDRTIRIWTAPKSFRPMSNHTDIVMCAAFSRDGRRLISGSLDQTVRLWDVASQKQLGSWHAHPGGTLRVRFAPDGLSAASSGVDGSIKFWDFKPRPPGGRIQTLAADSIKDAILIGDPPMLATVQRGNEWQVSSLPSFEERHRGQLTPNFFASLKSIGLGRILEFAGSTVQSQAAADGRIETLAQCNVGDILSVDLATNGQTLVISGVNGIAVWQLSERREIRRWETPREGWSRHVRLTPDGSVVVTLHEHDGAVTFRDVSSGRTTELPGSSIGSSLLAFSPDSQRLATAGTGAAVQVYDVPRRESIAALGASSGQVTALAFSPDATRLACGASGGNVTLWDLQTRREVAILRGHGSMIYSLAFLDDDTLASASREEVRLWTAPRPGRISHPANDTPARGTNRIVSKETNP